MRNELTESLFDVMNITVYRGVTIHKLIGGFEVFGIVVKTKEEVNKLIDDRLRSLEKSIYKQ